jgi:hypothetical protein
MHLGFGLPMAGDWATPQNQLRVARAAEDLGLDDVLAHMEALAPRP